MGQRGPIRNPNSRRGRAEVLKLQKVAAAGAVSASAGAQSATVTPASGGSLPTCDTCLPRRVQEIYQNLVIDLAGAKVPIKQIDAHAITMAARSLEAIEAVEKMFGDGDLAPESRLAALRLKGQFSKDLIQWLQLICATPGARARIGLKAPAEKKAGPLEKMIAARMKRGS